MNATENSSIMSKDKEEQTSSHARFKNATLYTYTYITPLIFAIGLIGNAITLKVFNSAVMKTMSASVYLSCLALADTSVLVFYVLSEWIRRGLPLLLPDINFSIIDANGACQIREYLSHLSRLLSSWVIVAFTCERCVSVCFPLKTLQKSHKLALCVLLTICSIVMVYTLYMNMSHSYGDFRVCSYRDGYEYEHFIAESMFVTLIFFLPFLIITVANAMIIRTLYHRGRNGIQANDNSNIKIEFFMMMFAISLFYIVFHIPYFIVWCRLRIITNPKESSVGDGDFWIYWNGILSICRPIYYMNYCSNFFLYCITGAKFRSEMKKIFICKRQTYNSVKTHIRATELSSFTRNCNTSPSGFSRETSTNRA